MFLCVLILKLHKAEGAKFGVSLLDLLAKFSQSDMTAMACFLVRKVKRI